jgi:hypothetical protein
MAAICTARLASLFFCNSLPTDRNNLNKRGFGGRKKNGFPGDGLADFLSRNSLVFRGLNLDEVRQLVRQVCRAAQARIFVFSPSGVGNPKHVALWVPALFSFQHPAPWRCKSKTTTALQLDARQREISCSWFLVILVPSCKPSFAARPRAHCSNCQRQLKAIPSTGATMSPVGSGAHKSDASPSLSKRFLAFVFAFLLEKDRARWRITCLRFMR